MTPEEEEAKRNDELQAAIDSLPIGLPSHVLLTNPPPPLSPGNGLPSGFFAFPHNPSYGHRPTGGVPHDHDPGDEDEEKPKKSNFLIVTARFARFWLVLWVLTYGLTLFAMPASHNLAQGLAVILGLSGVGFAARGHGYSRAILRLQPSLDLAHQRADDSFTANLDLSTRLADANQQIMSMSQTNAVLRQQLDDIIDRSSTNHEPPVDTVPPPTVVELPVLEDDPWSS